MFAHVASCLKVVLCYCALELYHPDCSTGHRPTALFCVVVADVPVCACLASPSGSRSLLVLSSLVRLFDPALLSLLPVKHRDKSNITLRWGVLMGKAGLGSSVKAWRLYPTLGDASVGLG